MWINPLQNAVYFILGIAAIDLMEKRFELWDRVAGNIFRTTVAITAAAPLIREILEWLR